MAETESEGFYQRKSGSKGSEIGLVLINCCTSNKSKVWKLLKLLLLIKDLRHDSAILALFRAFYGGIVISKH